MDCVQIADRFFKKNPCMAVTLMEDSSGVILRLKGSLDMETSMALQELLLHVIDTMSGHMRLLVDLHDVNYVPSSGVGALTIALTMARKRYIRLQLGGIQPKVKSVIELLGFMSFFEEVNIDA